jgi:hypothetical protein
MAGPNPISGKGGSVTITTLGGAATVYPMKDWSATFEQDALDVTSFASRPATNTEFPHPTALNITEYARKENIASIGRINIECSGFTSFPQDEFLEGNTAVFVLGLNTNPAIVLPLTIIDTSATTRSLSFRITNVSYTNAVDGALEWNISATSVEHISP